MQHNKLVKNLTLLIPPGLLLRYFAWHCPNH
jgi:hypothetical protein